MIRRGWRPKPLAALSFALALFWSAAQAGPLSFEGTAPWEVCGLCHGYEGRTQRSKFPKLAGQKPGYIVKQLEDFAAERRENGGGQMREIVTEVAEKDYAAIAEWFAGQTPAPPEEPEGDAALGAKLYASKSCGVCHGSQNTPPRPLIPHITAQHEKYLTKQLKDFRAGDRTNDLNGMMRLHAKRLTDLEIEALAAYLASEERR